MRPWSALIVPPAADDRAISLLGRYPYTWERWGSQFGARIEPPAAHPAALGPAIDELCELLVQLNVEYLRGHPRTPRLYASGVRYRAEDGAEEWLSIPWVLWRWRHGAGSDCEDLAAWRAAELRVFEREPTAKCVWSAYPGPKVVYHIRVRRADGRIEDPSLRLGMRRH